MQEPSACARRVRFGVFEVDLRSGELRKAGNRIALQEQPFRILVRLLEHPGGLVTREELRQELWPADTFVDFDHGLNAAISRLRDALGDGADSPRFVETIPRRGYRFIAPVDGAGASPTERAAGRTPRRPRVLVVALLVGIAGTVSAVSFFGWRRMADRPSGGAAVAAMGPRVHEVIDVPADAPLALGVAIPSVGFDSATLALSPDGTRLAYVGRAGKTTKIFLRGMDDLGIRPVPGTEGAIHPFFSPDGRSLGFLTDSQVKSVPVTGGTPQTIGDTLNPFRGRWLDDGIYVAYEFGNRLGRMSAHNGALEEISALAGRASPGRFSDVLPGGKWALVTSFSNPVNANHAAIRLVSLERDDTRVLVRSGFSPIYAPPGRLVFARGGDVLSVRFDPITLRIAGEPEVVASDVAMNSLFASAQMCASANGVLSYLSGGDHAVSRPAWVDRAGRVDVLPLPPQVYGGVRLSPDNSRLALNVADVTSYVLIHSLAGGEPRKITADDHLGLPAWSPDGRSIAVRRFPVRADQPQTVIIRSVDDPMASRELWAGADAPTVTSWHPAGDRVAVTARRPYRIGFARLGDRPEFANADVDKWGANFSPDGEWIVYTRFQRNRVEAFMQSYPDGGTGRQVSLDGGREPVWCRCGDLMFRQGRRWMRVTVTGNPPVLSSPQPAFDTDFVDTDGVSYDLSRDGRRLLVLKRVNGDVQPKLHVRVNWADGLR